MQIKKFNINDKLELGLEDVSEIDNWIITKSSNIINKRTFYDKIEHENILKDFYPILDHDLKTAIFPPYNTQISSKELAERRREAICSSDTVYYLGNVYLHLHKYCFSNNLITNFKIITNGVVNLSEILLEIKNNYYLYVTNYDKNPHNYGLNLLMVSLIERLLKMLIIDKIVESSINLLLNSSLEDNERNYFLDFVSGKIVDDYKNVHRKLHFMFEKYNIYKLPIEEYEKLFKDKYSLREFINSKIFTNECNVHYYQLMKILFVDIDLRNNLAHLNLGDFDYFGAGYTAILFHLLQAIEYKILIN